MANDFHSMTIRNMLPERVSYKVNAVIPPDDLMDYAPPDVQSPDGSFNVPLLQPAGDQHHLALGRFMDAWSKLEMTLAFLLAGVLELKHSRTTPLTNSLGVRGTLDTISALAHGRISEAKRDELAKLIDRIKENNTRRNYLAHGYWMLEWAVVDQGGKPAALPRIYRAYTPTDPELANKLKNPRNRKERLRFMFAPKRIEALVKAVLALKNDINSFASANFPLIDQPANKQSNIPVAGCFFSAPTAKPATNDVLGLVTAKPIQE